MSTPRHREESMSLLHEVMQESVDPDYAVMSARRHPRQSPVAFLLVIVVIGALFITALVQTTRARPAIAQERQELMSRLAEQRRIQDDLRAATLQRQREVQDLEKQALGNDESSRRLAQDLTIAEQQAGATVVTGPGVEIVVDDAPDGSEDGRVVDTDLQALANGLWQSGAEAITINGHRLTSASAIRGAGEAITVDYRSLTRPYTIRVIGDPDTLATRFQQSAGGQWWAMVEDRYGLKFNMAVKDEMTLEAGAPVTLRHAKEQA